MWQTVGRVGNSRVLRLPFQNPVSRRIAYPFVAILFASITSSFEGYAFDVEERTLLVDADKDQLDAGIGLGAVKSLPAILGLGVLLWVFLPLSSAAMGGGIKAAVAIATALFVGAVGLEAMRVECRGVETLEEL